MGLKWGPHPTWVTTHGPAPGGDAQAATHNHANSRASSCVARRTWPPRRKILMMTHTKEVFFKKQIPLASVYAEFFVRNGVFLNFLECL